jgi:hypothetical protein
MPSVTLDSRVSAAEDAVFRELEGEAVIVHLGSGMYYGLDPVGTRLWQLIETHGGVQAVFDAALEEFDVEPDVLRRDLVQLVTDLVGRHLLVLK